MPNVHLFRYVWRRVVDHDRLRICSLNTKIDRLQRRICIRRQPIFIQENVDKAWSCNF